MNHLAIVKRGCDENRQNDLRPNSSMPKSHERQRPVQNIVVIIQSSGCFCSAESGKSTLLKQFQMLYAPHTLDAERAAWRGVVFLNIIKALRTICETHDFEYGSNNGTPAVYDPWSDAYTPPASPKGTPGRDNLTTVKLHLAPLLGLEATLAQRIGSGFNLAGRTEFCVRRGWQDNTQFTRPSSGKRKVRSRSGSVDADRGIGNGKAPESELHLDVQTVLADYELNRITQPGYLPSDDDILRARIRTIGISEWSFQFTYPGKKNLCNWRLFDVGGARSQRAHWAPYFEDATAIVFLAPISAYDQYLEEDARTNRIDDSLQLWTQITSSPILKEVHLVLFLNKCDVLRGKLAAGVKVKKYITSYGDRPNEYAPVSHYFRAHFSQVFKRNNTDSKRELYCHLTSVIDTQATQSIILSVRDGLFRANLKHTGLI
ncbi:unnamed protein product [Rhizoctonia solani]|uniref:Guanine nucleotide-binding protein alpha-4 subunit [Ustilago maydis 521] n=1 Tax=Rhizoctonia solani TaxID=456999 RepID=A0A8H3GPA1_9AGAM|nr:unnamed protein product [Rhizoctonia solani]